MLDTPLNLYADSSNLIENCADCTKTLVFDSPDRCCTVCATCIKDVMEVRKGE